jgi:hypothetical protein
MSLSTLASPATRRGLPFVIGLYRFLASLTLAVSLLLALAAVLAGATIIETYQGAEAACWYVYGSTWFRGLLGLLAVNIFCAAAIRIPWQRHQTGFVVTHVGLLTLLAGAGVSAWSSREGRVTLLEGDSTTEMVLNHRSRITAFHVGRPEERPYEFSFQPRPFDWDATTTLPVGEVDGVAVRVVALIHHPRLQERWIADDARIGGPAVRFKVSDSTGRQVAESWRVDQQFGEPGVIGPLRMQLERAVNDRMLSDFQHPPQDEHGERGLLLAYFGIEAARIPVEDNVGRTVPLGDSDVAIEIVDYLPNARPDRMGTFASADDRPLNPMLELRVMLPGEEQPLRQVAFAKDPLLNLDGVYGRACPVTFRYVHPTIAPQAAVALLQTSDGKLHARVSADGGSEYRDEIRTGDTIDVPAGFVLEVVDYLPHARRHITFEPDPRSKKTEDEPAALVEISADGTMEQVWMRRNGPVYGRRVITTPAGAMALQFEHAREPLGFSLELMDFQRQMNPGNAGNAAFSSRVRVTDLPRGVQEEHIISLNEPLTYAGLTLYQYDFDDAGHGRESSTFSVASDPGRPLKYAGSLLVCAGIAIMFYMRAYFFKNVA